MSAPSQGINGAQTDVSTSRASVSPSSVSDQPTVEDTLGFEPYVAAVAAFLMHPETRPPLTLSVEGSWGSGKSSFMLQVQSCLNRAGAKTVWFNAWRHDKEDELWAAFALDFTNKLAATAPAWERWLLHIKLGYLRFNFRKGWFQLTKYVVLGLLFIFVTVRIGMYAASTDSPVRTFFARSASTENKQPTVTTSEAGAKQRETAEALVTLLLKVGGTAGYILLGFAGVRKIKEIIGNPLEIHLTNYMQDPKYETRAAFVETFHSDFKRLVDTYARGTRVFVFIDDLDRCEVPKAADLMQALNLLISESAPVFYILGLDREKIAAGLAAKYEKLLPYLAETGSSDSTSSPAVGIEFGYNYIEKFIQLPFLVPEPADKDIDNFLNSLSASETMPQSSPAPAASRVDPGLLVELSTDSEAVRRIVKMVAPSLDYNPRRLKQFLNLFRLRALLASQTGLFGTPRDLNKYSPLTFEQLGKLVAIMLRWPLLLADVERTPELLALLQTYAWGGAAMVGPPASGIPKFWFNKIKLMELIKYPSAAGASAEYGLERVDIVRFLQVSPIVSGREMAGSRSPSERSRAADESTTAALDEVATNRGQPHEEPSMYDFVKSGLSRLRGRPDPVGEAATTRTSGSEPETRPYEPPSPPPL